MMHHHSPAMKMVGMITWLVTALAAVAVGLEALGITIGKQWDIWQSAFVANNLPWIVQPAHYVIGAAGLVSLLIWFACLGCNERHDGRSHR